MLRADPGFVRCAPFKERKTGEPEKFPTESYQMMPRRFAKLQTKLAGDECGGLGALDLFFGGDSDDEIARFRATGVGEFFHIFCTEQFFDGGSRWLPARA